MRALYDLPAPAKLNLFLHVTRKRADGYHLLQSVFVLIDWQDTLHIERRNDGRLHRHDLGTHLPADDLCLRAARALQQASGTPLGADIHIDKHIPWGAGLGGGSSDAATVLLALNRLWELHWPRQRLLQLAATAGADVPFFILGRPAWVEGIGEQLTPLPPSAALPTHYAVVKPPQALPTAAVFASPHLLMSEKPAIVADFLAAPRGYGRNDLQEAAKALSSDVTQALELLSGTFGNSRMTGSGSAVFAWTSDVRHSAWTAALPQGWTGRLCQALPAHPLVGWASDPENRGAG
ncbi:MAG: 4-(cytidine 5'-diphospho)-2-C-methyl-D-erythritol kinase [Aquabacterium sp.]|nr:4-(cytidine 5'-diphospho)-2-C-methyl-D-erythritol kinase [Aquabacterium sp.]